VTSIITQNVDRLHHKAGSENVIELHGTGFIVKCLKCPYEISRQELQQTLLENNPDMQSTISMIRPDGDVELTPVSRFDLLLSFLKLLKCSLLLLYPNKMKTDCNIPFAKCPVYMI
jgi:hypothetical protein